MTRAGVAALAVGLASQHANAQHSDEQLAKQLANPVAVLISLPFQRSSSGRSA